MNTDISFLRDEVRNGFYIPTAIKQCFAAELSVLKTIDDICRKHDIQYFADWGTLLATVRHGGYIPWDDDLDIGMKRSDYIKFMKVAQSELPKSYDIHTYETKENHWLFITKILGTSRINFEPEYLNQNDNFPYIACVDIFLVDNLYKDEEKEKERTNDIIHILSVADGIVDGKIEAYKIDYLLDEIERSHNITINHKTDARHIGIDLYKLVEKRMAEVPDDEAGNIGQIFPWVLKGGKGYPKYYYDNLIRLPYENTTIPVPAAYNQALNLHYGQYLNVVKGVAGHNYPFFEGQRKNLQAIANFELPEYRFKDEFIIRRNANKESSLKSLSEALINSMAENHNKYDGSLEIISDCQQLAIDLGTIIENVKGEGTSSVKHLEEYCEILYFLSQNNSDEDFNSLISVFEKIKTSINEEIVNRKTVLFLTITPEWWDSFDNLYKSHTCSKDTDVYVVPLPTIRKNAYGKLLYEESFDNNSACNGANANISKSFDNTLVDYSLTGYPSYVTLYDFEKINIELLNPDIIYYQEASDSENPCYSVPVNYYSDRLQLFTDRLVYIMPLKIADFTKDDYCENYNLKHYLYKPGIMKADEIYVHSENTRERFIEGLTGFSDNTREHFIEGHSNFSDNKYYDYWARKIKVQNSDTWIEANTKTADNTASDTRSRDIENTHDATSSVTKKSIFYCIGENEITESADIIDFIKRRIDILLSNSDKLNIVIGFYPENYQQWKLADQELIGKFQKTLNVNNSSVTILSKNDTDLILKCDAYYGAPSPYVRRFIDLGKPVMIENLEV